MQTPPADNAQLLHATAEAVRAACLQAALDGYERAGMSGLCEEGRIEMLLDAIRSLDVDALVHQALAGDTAAAGNTGVTVPH